MVDCYHLNPAATCTFMQLKFINFSRKLLFFLFVNATLPAGSLQRMNNFFYFAAAYWKITFMNTGFTRVISFCWELAEVFHLTGISPVLKTPSNDGKRNLK